MSNEKTELMLALAKKVAHFEVPEDVITKTVERIAGSKEKIRGIDICTHGICLDYIIQNDQPWEGIEKLVTIDDSPTKGVEIFPWGISSPEILHVQVKHEMPELAKYIK